VNKGILPSVKKTKKISLPQKAHKMQQKKPPIGGFFVNIMSVETISLH
jgi:hypothetical protein